MARRFVELSTVEDAAAAVADLAKAGIAAAPAEPPSSVPASDRSSLTEP